jgi:hypothetical protein
MQANCTAGGKLNFMTTSDDFKEQLKAGNIVEALTLVLGNSVELEITTWVSSSNSEAQTSTGANQSPANSRMRTRVNIVDAEIDNEVGSQFIGNGPYTELRQFHMDQVHEGPKIIQQNLENLQHLFTVLTNTMARIPEVPPRRVDGNSVLSPSQDNFS